MARRSGTSPLVAAARIAAVLAGVLAGPVFAESTVRDPGCGTIVLPLRPDVRVYSLSRGFLTAGADSGRVGDAWWRRQKDYVLEPLRGELRLLREPLPGDTLRLDACWLLTPPPFERQLHSFRPRVGVRDSVFASAPDSNARRPHPVAARDPSTAPAGASLALNGNKTIAVDFGSRQDAFLRQSLDLSVSGTLAPGVELTGVLSDRSTPGSAAQSTRDLESLDRVLIELKAPRGGGALGDLGWSVAQGEFARVERRLQGVSGQWRERSFTGAVAAASAPGEFHRLEFFGSDGRQGPYLLTDRDGAAGVTVVAGSEIVTVDGVRMSRGESADYSIDYERAQLTFTNRRPISSASRVSVEYQYSVLRYKRNLLSFGGRWERPSGFAFVQGLSEGDDRGRPIDATLTLEDRAALESAGDSLAVALSSGVTPGPGDYDTLRVDSARVVFVYAGADSGAFAVRFTRVAAGAGDYLESARVSGRPVFHYVGTGQGTHRVGRSLPSPESRKLWSMGGGVTRGPLGIEVEGAMSQRDRNLFSARDDGDNRGEAGRVTLRLAGKSLGPRVGAAGLEVRARAVARTFDPFAPLEPSFAEENWGLPADADLDHQKRLDVSGYLEPRRVGRMRASLARLVLPSGFDGWGRGVEWTRDGTLAGRTSFERSDGVDPRYLHGESGRERLRGELRARLRWAEPVVRIESDERRFASDTGRVGDRHREAGVELHSGAAVPWRVMAGYGVRREATASGEDFADQREARTVKLGFDSPAGRSYGAAALYQRRAVRPLDQSARLVSDLGTLSLWGENAPHGLNGRVQVEITEEGESRRERRLTYLGPGLGGYDALGNFVGRGDYDLVVVVGAGLERLSHATTSMALGWQPGGTERGRGSRVTFDFQSEARRRGGVAASDPWVSPGTVRGDPGLARGRVLQRVEADLAPGSRTAAVRLRAERTVTTDRSFENFAQTLEERTLDGRWRARPGPGVTSEVAVRHRESAAEQQLEGGLPYARRLLEDGGQAQLVVAPRDRWRAVAALDVSFRKPEAGAEATRTIRVGPDFGVSVGARGRAEVSLRRGFVSGPPTPGLLPGPESLDAPAWEGDSRFDYRLRDGVSFALSLHGRSRVEADPLVTGRLEARAFF